MLIIVLAKHHLNTISNWGIVLIVILQHKLVILIVSALLLLFNLFMVLLQHGTVSNIHRIVSIFRDAY
jgi:hypothetical protein